MIEGITASDIENFITKNRSKDWVEITEDALREIKDLKDENWRYIVLTSKSGRGLICGVEYIVNNEADGLQLCSRNMDGSIDIKSIDCVCSIGKKVPVMNYNLERWGKRIGITRMPAESDGQFKRRVVDGFSVAERESGCGKPGLFGDWNDVWDNYIAKLSKSLKKDGKYEAGDIVIVKKDSKLAKVKAVASGYLVLSYCLDKYDDGEVFAIPIDGCCHA